MNEFQSVGQLANAVVRSIGSDRAWDGQTITEGGVYAGIPIDVYHNDVDLLDAFSISSSGLRQVIKRPLEYWYQSPFNPDRTVPDAKKELDFGRAAHTWLMEGEVAFKEQFAVCPEIYENNKGEWKPWNAGSNACKAWLEEQIAAGRTTIKANEFASIQAISDSLASKEPVRLGILNGRVERSIFYRAEDIWLKARPDVIPASSGDFVDLKTAASVDTDSLSMAIYKHGYHVQAGLMRWIVREVLGKDAFASFTFVFVEKTAPYDVRIMTLKDTDIDRGEHLAHLAVQRTRECLKANEWPGFDGFGQHISYIEMPAWAQTRTDNNIHAEKAA